RPPSPTTSPAGPSRCGSATSPTDCFGARPMTCCALTSGYCSAGRTGSGTAASRSPSKDSNRAWRCSACPGRGDFHVDIRIRIRWPGAALMWWAGGPAHHTTDLAEAAADQDLLERTLVRQRVVDPHRVHGHGEVAHVVGRHGARSVAQRDLADRLEVER